MNGKTTNFRITKTVVRDLEGNVIDKDDPKMQEFYRYDRWNRLLLLFWFLPLGCSFTLAYYSGSWFFIGLHLLSFIGFQLILLLELIIALKTGYDWVRYSLYPSKAFTKPNAIIMYIIFSTIFWLLCFMSVVTILNNQ